MHAILCTLALNVAALAGPSLPIVMPSNARGLAPADAIALHARFDPSLGALRAGRVDAPGPFGADERAQLATAQRNSTTLAALRGGSSPTDHEWKWLAIGGVIVLLLVVI